MTTAAIATSDYTVTSLLSAAIGFVMEALTNGDVPLACNLLSQTVMATSISVLFSIVTMVTGP